MKYQNWFVFFLAWRRRNFSERAFVLITATIVGIISGLAAIFLKTSVHFIESKLTSEAYTDNYYQLLYPIIGLLITVILSRWVYKENQEHAISDIIFSIQNRFSKLHYSKTYSHLLTSIFTVGFGGSAGLESPIVYSGSAIGSNIGKLTYFNYNNRTLLMGCGTAGVISAIFNAPIAGLIFSIEIILSKVSVSNFIPLLISSVTASLISSFLQETDILFFFPIKTEFLSSQTYLFLFLGIFCGFISLVFRKVLEHTEYTLKKISNPFKRIILAGSLLSVIIFLFPATYGEGYVFIKQVLAGETKEIFQRSVLFEYIPGNSIYLFLLFLLIIAKMYASAITIGGGGSGGTFAPSFVVGAFTGLLFSQCIQLLDITEVSQVSFIFVGMCGVLCGMQYAPLTAIFLIAEITGGYTLFIPLMIVSAVTFTTVSIFEPNSIYLKPLIKKGLFVKDEADNRVLSKLSFENIIEKDLKVIREDQTLGDLVKLVMYSKRNIFPVINKEGEFKGIVTLDTVREMMFDEQKYDKIYISSILEKPPVTVEYKEGMESVMNKFEMYNLWNLPVLEKGKYLGFLSKSKIFTLYRYQLLDNSNTI